MPRILLLALAAAAALLLGAAPAIAASTPPATAHVATFDECDPDLDLDCDEWEDDEDWDDEWTDDEEWCDDEWIDDEEWDDEDLASVSTSDDDEWIDDEELCDWEDEADEELPPVVSKLKATPKRGRGVRVDVRFRLDRAGDVELRLERIDGSKAKASGGCARKKARKAKRCAAKPVALHGTITLTGRDGVNETTLRTWKGKRLAPGSYRLTVTPTAAGADEAQATFKLKPRKR